MYDIFTRDGGEATCDWLRALGAAEWEGSSEPPAASSRVSSQSDAQQQEEEEGEEEEKRRARHKV